MGWGGLPRSTHRSRRADLDVLHGPAPEVVASPEPAAFLTFRRALTPVFVHKRYPRNYWLLLDAICELAGYFPTVPLGTYSLPKRTGLHRRTVRHILERLESEGVLQLVEQSPGGRFPDNERRGAPGRANVYAVGPAARNLPLKLPLRTGAKTRRFGGKEQAQFRAGLTGKEQAQFRATTHVLSGEVRSINSVSGDRVGMGKGERKGPSPTSTRSDYCQYCDTYSGHHVLGCTRPRRSG